MGGAGSSSSTMHVATCFPEAGSRTKRACECICACVCVCLTCVCLHVLVRMPSISTKRTRFALHSGYSSSLRKARTGAVGTGGFGAGGLSLATVCGLLRAGGTASYYCIKYCMNLLPSSQCNNKCTNNRNRTGSVVRGMKNADLSRPALGLCIARSRSARGPFFCSRGLPGTRFLRVCGSATTKILHACVCLCVCCVGYPCNLAARAAVCVRVLLVARRRVLHCLQNFHHQLCCVFFFFLFCLPVALCLLTRTPRPLTHRPAQCLDLHCLSLFLLFLLGSRTTGIRLDQFFPELDDHVGVPGVRPLDALPETYAAITARFIYFKTPYRTTAAIIARKKT